MTARARTHASACGAVDRVDSGGPLVDGRGEVLGIDSQAQTTAGGGEGPGTRRSQARGFSVGADIITRVNGKTLADEAVLAVALLSSEPGQEITPQAARNGRPRGARVRLGPRPQQTGAAGRP